MKVKLKTFNLRIVKEKEGVYDLDRKITGPDGVVRVLNEVTELNQRTEEVFVMLTLDIKKSITGVFEVSVGSINSSLVTPREIYKRAILQNASAIIIAHNHPSGSLDLSAKDVNVTEALVEAGEILGIEMLDHLVIGDGNNFLSMKGEGII